MDENRCRMVAIYETRDELEALFNEDFMRQNTNLASFEEFRFSSAVFVNWNAKFIVTSREALDCCVKGKTRFNTWEAFYQAAQHRQMY